MDDYWNARCCALTKAGRRCTGRWASAVGCLFEWDPIKGVGIEAPMVVLCHRHRHYVWNPDGVKSGRRFRLAHGGWLGCMNRYGYGTAVWDREDSGPHMVAGNPAPWWWARRTVVRFSQRNRTEAA